jgi:hypothetical protein
MATDRRAILATFADRVAVREYVREKVGDRALTRVYTVTDAPETIRRSELPSTFVLKASHGSGGMVVVGEHVPNEVRLPAAPVGWERLHVHPDGLEWNRLVDICRHWLGLRYEPYQEWAYTQVKPRILCEELLTSGGGGPVTNYMFFVFSGVVRLVEISERQFPPFGCCFYTPQWELLDIQDLQPEPLPKFTLPEPARLDEMIDVAERLADGIDFIRVDLYNVDERVVFGEMTCYPDGGWSAFDPPEFDRELGELWRQAI